MGTCCQKFWLVGMFLTLHLAFLWGEEYRHVTLEQLKNWADQYHGQKVQIKVKIQDILGGIVYVQGSPLKILVEVGVNKLNQELAPGDNAIFWGVFDAGEFQISATRFKKAKSDTEELERQYELLKAAGKYDKLEKLGRRALRLAKVYSDAQLAQLAEKIFFDSLVLKEEAAKKNPLLLDTFQKKLYHALAFFYLAKSRKAALERLVKLLQAYPDKTAEIRKYLQNPKGIHAVEVYHPKKSKWIFWEEYLKSSGNLRYEGKWLSEEQVIWEDFLRDYLKEQKDSLYFSFHDVMKPNRPILNFSVIAGRGEIKRAMLKREVVEAWGYPERTYGRVVRGRSLEMWVYYRPEKWYTLRGRENRFPSKVYYLFFDKELLIGAYSLKDLRLHYRKND